MIFLKKKKEKKVPKEEKKIERKPLPEDFKIIKKPIVSEKSTLLSKEGKYVFEVDFKANKNQIKKAIERIYNTQVKKINIIKKKGKTKRWLRIFGKTPRRKLAIATLKRGEKIEILSR